MVSSRDRWRRRVGIGFTAGLIAITAISIDPIRSAVEATTVVKSYGASAGSLTVLLIMAALLSSYLFSALDHIARFIDDPASEAARGTIAQVREQLGDLIGQALHNRRLVVFVDDLKRCAPARAMEVCEVANQLLSHPNVVTVFIADMHLIAKSAEERFRETSSGGDAGRRYLEKIVQLQLTLPPPKSADLEPLLKGCTPLDVGRTPLSSGECDERERRPLSSAFERPSDVPDLIAQVPDRRAGIRPWRHRRLRGRAVAGCDPAWDRTAAPIHGACARHLGRSARIDRHRRVCLRVRGCRSRLHGRRIAAAHPPAEALPPQAGRNQKADRP